MTKQPRSRRVSLHAGGRTQINRGGAPHGNVNAKKTLSWLDSYDLSTSDGVRGFLQEIIKHTWIAWTLGAVSAFTFAEVFVPESA